MTRRTRVNPRIIREALELAESSGQSAAGRRFGVDHGSVARWQGWRAQDPAWPTDQDIATWEQLDVERRRDRARKAAQKRDYMKRRAGANGAPMMIASTGTTRRLRALYALGWTSAQIAPLLGVNQTRVGHLIAGQQAEVHRHTAARVAAIYDQLSMTVPQDAEVRAHPRMVRVHDRQRRQSLAKGWAPPLAWDDDTLDDPYAQPTVHVAVDKDQDSYDPAVVQRLINGEWGLESTRADRTEVVRRWCSRGWSLYALEKHTGWRTERYRTTEREKAS